MLQIQTVQNCTVYKDKEGVSFTDVILMSYGTLTEVFTLDGSPEFRASIIAQRVEAITKRIYAERNAVQDQSPKEARPNLQPVQ